MATAGLLAGTFRKRLGIFDASCALRSKHPSLQLLISWQLPVRMLAFAYRGY
jgi:hypothetical protein